MMCSLASEACSRKALSLVVVEANGSCSNCGILMISLAQNLLEMIFFF